MNPDQLCPDGSVCGHGIFFVLVGVTSVIGTAVVIASLVLSLIKLYEFYELRKNYYEKCVQSQNDNS